MPFAIALSAGLLAWSLVANLVIGEVAYVPRNLVLTALLLAWARWRGFGDEQLGLSRHRLMRGLRWGAMAVAVVASVLVLPVALGDRLGPLQVLLQDERAQLPPAGLAWAALVRIPVGTALFEEVAFRGVLLAAFLRATSTVWAVTWSNVVFGLWHVAPTLVALELNGVAPFTTMGLQAVVAGVLITAIGGALFTWLRLGSRSLVAPILAHWATNSLGLLAAAWNGSDPSG